MSQNSVKKNNRALFPGAITQALHSLIIDMCSLFKQTALAQELTSVKSQIEDLQREKVWNKYFFYFNSFTPRVKTFKSGSKKPWCVTIQMKAVEQYFHVVLFDFDNFGK